VEASFSAWLYRLVDHYRRTRGTWVNDTSLPELPDPAPSQEQLANDADCVDRLQTALGRLPAAQREAFLLREETELSLEQIGVIACVGRETIKNRLRYALQHLRAAMEDCL